MYKPQILEVLKNAFFLNKTNNYYIKEMRYPSKGGYKSFISGLANKNKILFNHEILEVDATNKSVTFKNGNIHS
jgi:protoporphyrinogen oxidase